MRTVYNYCMSETSDTVVILAGGRGTRMREMTDSLPKPMVEIGGKPVLEHLINYFESFQNFNFIICTGYKEEIIEKYFTKNNKFLNVKIISTGLDTNTGGRILQCKNLIKSKFIMTYGDGLSDININNLLDFNKHKNQIGTVSTTRPVSRFGLLETDKNDNVVKFIEKPILDSYINMGYMVFNKNVFDFIDGDEPFEKEPLKRLTLEKELNAYKHQGFFRPMDTYREYLELNELWKENNAPWKVM